MDLIPSRGPMLAVMAALIAASAGCLTKQPKLIKDNVVLTPEARAARAGAPYDWELPAIRKEIEAQAGRVTYPDDPGPVETAPDSIALKAKSTAELFAMSRFWNPAFVSAAARELGRRGPEIYEQVMANVSSDDPRIRASSAAVINGMLNQLRGTPKGDPRRGFLASRVPAMVNALTRLLRDPHIRVRREAVPAYRAVGMATHGMDLDLSPMILAAVTQTSEEPDANLCEQLASATAKFGWIQQIPKDLRGKLLGKALLLHPLPRGRGAVFSMIKSLASDEIEALLPVLLKNFKTPMFRDTMFFPGGVPDSFVLITQYREKYPEIFEAALAHVDDFNQQAWVQFDGRHRKGLKPYWECLATLGPEAAVALPSLRRILAKTTSPEYIAYGRSVIERIQP